MNRLDRFIFAVLLLWIYGLTVSNWELQKKTSELILYSKRYQSLAGALRDLNIRTQGNHYNDHENFKISNAHDKRSDSQILATQ